MAFLFRFEQVTYHLSSGNRQIVVSGAIEAGAVLVVRGPSGSGKSTLLRILARLQTCDSGKVFFKNNNWHTISPLLWRSKVHYVAQKPAIFKGTVLDNLKKPFNLTNIKKEKSFNPKAAKEGLQQLLLPAEIMEQDAQTLSGGEAARMAILRSVLCEPNIILLDEPTAALDEKSSTTVQIFLNEWIQNKPDRGLILVSHDHNINRSFKADLLNIGPVSEVLKE